MPAQDQTGVQDAKLVCRKCKTPSLRRRTPTFFNQLTSFYPYSCGRCGSHQKKFRFTLATITPLLLILAAGGGAFWLWQGRPTFMPGAGESAAPAASQDQTEALARARAVVGGGGQLSTFEQMILHKQKASMDNATVLKLVKANVDNDIIIQLIHTSNPDYDVTANAIIDLKAAGVDHAIIMAMISASYAPK